MRKLFLKILASGILVCGVVGCKKISYDLTKNSEPKDQPEYTTEFDPNLSPAEEAVKKAGN